MLVIHVKWYHFVMLFFLYLNPRIGWGDYGVCTGFFLKLKVIIVINQHMISELPARCKIQRAFKFLNVLRKDNDMKKKFNSSQMLETSEDCYKFSKSVSYETLVGGTATICTDIKQTQRLSEGSADKPLTAVGTLTSLLCNSAKVVENLLRYDITRRTSVRRGYLPEKCTHANEESLFASVTRLMRLPRRIQRMLLVMTIPMLVLIFILITTTESQATTISCINGLREDGITTCEKCGDNCNWSYETTSKKLTVSGSGNMYDYERKEIDGDSRHTSAPWGEYKVWSLDVEGVSNIGKNAFVGLSLRSINMDDTVASISSYAFAYNYSNMSLELPDSLEEIASKAFRGPYIQSLIIPSTIKNIETGALGSDTYTISNMTIICMGGKTECDKLKEKLQTYTHLDGSNNKQTINLSGNVKLAGYKECVSTNYFWNGAECVREPDLSKRKCCSDVCKDVGGYCNRIRYTPAEAVEVLKDDNNFVVITFRK